jgi:7-cyano-7-deazaguanine synthase in queuosine biosynthesis
MTAERNATSELPSIRVDVVEPCARPRKGSLRCEIGSNLKFDTAKMESYFFAEWEPVLYDALLIAAAVEFCDRTQRRPASGWGRNIELHIPVHEPVRWSQRNVMQALHDTLEFLTGDRWQIGFYGRKQRETAPRQSLFSLSKDIAAVLPFSDGLDSQAVAGIMALSLGDKIVRVRLGSKDFDGGSVARHRQPFTSVPYKIEPGEREFVESSARSRAFKFALLSGLAAYLSKAPRVIVPESGQGTLGPTLVPVGQTYTDYRNHPLFTRRMERFLKALLGYEVCFEFPQLWHTKGETLARFVRECEEDSSSWALTWSCWQQSRHVSVEKRKRQCGICAACMLRRLSVHAAGLSEPKVSYVWEDLGALTFEAGAAAAFDRRRITGAMREYAIAGVLHLNHLAGLRRSSANAAAVNLSTFQLSNASGLPEAEVRRRLDRLLVQHETEWENFMGDLGPNSFVSQWVARA